MARMRRQTQEFGRGIHQLRPDAPDVSQSAPARRSVRALGPQKLERVAMVPRPPSNSPRLSSLLRFGELEADGRTPVRQPWSGRDE